MKPHMLVLAAGLLFAAIPAGHAADTAAQPTPQSATQPSSAGVYRFAVGDLRVAALSDGTLPLGIKPLVKGLPPERIDALLAERFERDPLETSINAFLIEAGPRLLLVDTGAGQLFGPYGGKLPASLAAAGYRPDQVTDILLTHIHTDHSGGLALDGRMVFPNATVHVGQADVDFFLDRGNLARGLQARHYDEAVATVGLYLKAGKVKPFAEQSEILPGVTAIPTPGHTPGHAFYRVASRGETIEFWGDIIHVGPVQFPHPEATVAFDIDQDAARAQRLKRFAEEAGSGQLTAAAHLGFPGLGRLRRDDDAYRWVPVEYRNRE
ncbi:MBL fold metallo-hydrolase [Azospirillum picis]|uniref:Glyoxylase-like metal-dependent hydrolase (Beta-lactamase superfamily II) n=1 Tax=Azospirillum picis TaxID=488438 RepID=A0ABU0MS98_9PROT|nr:MBL fold metallo-hydrolase [Azospirillum picis]MBP2301914.1 glyoxylase-like metal-dependent hydrolase (beta-lactamase superfamily II) [Azospirillum picis]MDQ0536363.1 glyoxylase-like metal-dependent hydrolase (beta-lactamase superfamily II) [Azospirillum picis]